MSWDDCQDFISKLNELTGRHFRLPSEAEWEYAARGGNKTHAYTYAGSNDIDAVAWYSGNTDMTHPVGQKAPNELGIYDMSGNVTEWCSDLEIIRSYSLMNPELYYLRIYRGGMYVSNSDLCTVWNRKGAGQTLHASYMGLRLVE